MELLIVTGMSGAGKTQCVRFLEDLGFYCMQNIPGVLLPELAEMYETGKMNSYSRAAMVVEWLDDNLETMLYSFKERVMATGTRVSVLFLDCSDEVLIDRHNAGKKLHPFGENGDISSGIAEERRRLEGIASKADRVIDTTYYSVWDLKKCIKELYADEKTARILLKFVSFGFKKGIPNGADYVFDVRCLPNPYWVPDLKPLNGYDERVKSFVLENTTAEQYLAKIKELISFVLPLCEQEGKAALTVAVGCTGGRHRSVAVAEELGRLFSCNYPNISVEHRDLTN